MRVLPSETTWGCITKWHNHFSQHRFKCIFIFSSSLFLSIPFHSFPFLSVRIIPFFCNPRVDFFLFVGKHFLICILLLGAEIGDLIYSTSHNLCALHFRFNWRNAQFNVEFLVLFCKKKKQFEMRRTLLRIFSKQKQKQSICQRDLYSFGVFYWKWDKIKSVQASYAPLPRLLSKVYNIKEPFVRCWHDEKKTHFSR